MNKLVPALLVAAGIGAAAVGHTVMAASEESTTAPAEQIMVAGNEAKVAVCHIPPGNPANAHTITVGASAVTAHIAHGDRVGSCVTGGGGGSGGGDGPPIIPGMG